VREVEGLVANGYKEVVLTGINIGDFDGGDKKATLADLVRAVDQVAGLERLRVSSIDPDEVDQNLLDAIVNGKKCCPSMHIVLQSGSNAILKRMNRKYTRQIFLETVERLCKANSEFTFTTDVIVGFPGETDEDFEETLDVIQKVGFAKVHMFPYSERKRTRAALFTNKIPQPTISMRKQKVLHLAEQVAFQKRAAYVGCKMEVLIEKEERAGCFFGHTANFLPVFVAADNLKSNDLIAVECLENRPEGLVACRLK
jgi:threonylcarbamoyladenosine tRNA methylthiotransferase MtaB